METTSGLELGVYRRVSLPPRHSIAALLSEISETSVSQLIVSEQNVLCVCVCQLSCIKNAKLYHVSIIPKIIKVMLCGVKCVSLHDVVSDVSGCVITVITCVRYVIKCFVPSSSSSPYRVGGLVGCDWLTVLLRSEGRRWGYRPITTSGSSQIWNHLTPHDTA